MDTLTPPESTVETPAATPEVVTPEAPDRNFSDFSKAERDSFLRDGKIPAKEKPATSSDAPADSSTAPAEGKKAAETAAKDVKAASEPAAPAKDKKEARNSAKQRTEEIDREIGELNDRLRIRNELRRQLAERDPKSDGKPASSTTEQPSEPKWKQVAASKEFPKIEDFESPNEWAAAVHLHTQQTIEAALSAKDVQTAEQSQHRQVLDEAYAKGVSEVEADPTILDRIDPGLEELKASRHLPKEQRTRATDLKDYILYDMRKPLGLLAYYSTPEGQAEWTQLRTMDGRDVPRTIIARELQLGSTVPQGEAAKGKEKPNVKTFTKAPSPPEKEGPKGAVAADGAKSAVDTGDFAAFQTEMDARDPGSARRFGRRRAS